MCSQPRISRQECIQASAGFLCIILIQNNATRVHDINAALKIVGRSSKDLELFILGDFDTNSSYKIFP